MSSNPSNNQPGQQQQDPPSWQDASLVTFLRRYFPVDNRPNYDFRREIRQARGILNALYALDNDPQQMPRIVQTIQDRPPVLPSSQQEVPFHNTNENRLIIIMLLIHDAANHSGGFYLPPLTEALQARAQTLQGGGQNTVTWYPQWQTPVVIQNLAPSRAIYLGPAQSSGSGRGQPSVGRGTPQHPLVGSQGQIRRGHGIGGGNDSDSPNTGCDSIPDPRIVCGRGQNGSRGRYDGRQGSGRARGRGC